MMVRVMGGGSMIPVIALVAKASKASNLYFLGLGLVTVQDVSATVFVSCIIQIAKQRLDYLLLGQFVFCIF